MSKKNVSIIKLTVICLVIALGLIFSFISFNGFAGFANASQKGLELEEGLYSNYNAIKADGISDEDYTKAVESTILNVESLIEQKGYQGAIVYKTSDNGIRIETPNIDDAESVLEMLGTGEFAVRISNTNTADIKLSGKDVQIATALNYGGSWGTYILFTEEGKATLSSLTQNSASSQTTLYFYRGDSANYFFYLPISSQITTGELYISNSDGSMTQEYATDLALQVSCGSLDTVLESDGVYEIGAMDGAMLGLSIASGVALLVILLIFALLYRELGLMSCLSMLFFVFGTLFLIQAIPSITLTSASIGGLLAGMILVAGANFVILENIKSEFALGKKLSMAVKTGYKKSVYLLADAFVIIFLAALAIYLIASGIVKSLGLIMIVSTLVACFSSLFLTWQLNDCYTVFNKNNGKRVNFTREENIDEIE